MKTFTQFIADAKENEEITSLWDMTSAFLIPRDQMPQVNVEDFVHRLSQLSIDWVKEKGIPSEFRPTQIDFDSEKANSIAMELSANGSDDNNPIIVSNDLYVLDGHHRYIGSIISGVPVHVLAVDLPINKLLKLAMDIYNE